MVHGRIKDVMTRALTIILVLALPVLAEEKKAEQPAATTTTASTKADATAAAKTQPASAQSAAQPAQPDSPLVAAAKRTNRLGKKKPTNVITNETLKSAGANAHVTTTQTQAIFQMPQPLEPPHDTPEMAAAKAQQAQRKQAAEQAETDRKAKEEQAKKQEAEAAAREEGYDGSQDDASELPGANPPPPQF